MLGLGAISSVIHFIISPENQNIIYTLKGSFIPMLVALMLYIVMNIMHQTQVAENERVRMEFTHALIDQISKLKEFIAKLEGRMVEYAKEESELRNDFMIKFNQDIETLGKLLHNQTMFMEKFEEVRKWHSDLTELFINFTEFKLPELDSIVHRHIEMLRISEGEHFEQLQRFLKETLGDKEEVREELGRVLHEIKRIESLSEEIAKKITEKTIEELSRVSQSFETELLSLKSHTEALKTSLYEGENTLEGIKNQSEFVIKQMVLISKKMEEFEEKKEMMRELGVRLMPLLEKIESIEKEYLQATAKLQEIIQELKQNEREYFDELTSKTQRTLERVDTKVDDTLSEIKEKYIVATDGISESVKILAKKAQLQKGGYNNEESF